MATYAVKGIGGNRFGGYTAVWGNPSQLDLQGDYFTRETDFALEAYDNRPLIHHHGQTDAVGRTIIGTIDTWRKDATGLWCEGEFKKLGEDIDLFDDEERKLREEYIQLIKNKIAAGELNFSSGALGHLVKRNDDGWLKQWFWSESSTTGSPAEPRKTEVSLLKAIKGLDAKYLAEGVESPANDTPEEKNETAVPTVDAPPPEAYDVSDATGESPENETDETENDSHDEGETDMTPEEIIAMITEQELAPEVLAEVVAQLETMAAEFASNDKAEGEDIPEDEEEDEKTVEEVLAKAIKSDSFRKSVYAKVKEVIGERETLKSQFAAMQSAAPVRGAGGTPLPSAKTNNTPRITAKSRLERAGWEPEDYAFYITAQRMKNKLFQPTNGFMREASSKMLDNHERLELSEKAISSLQQLQSYAKANELEHSTQVGYGDEWVQDGWATVIIQKARSENRILSLFNSVPMPTDPYTMPIEGSDPNIMAGAETTNAAQLTRTNANVTPLSKVGTGNITMSSGMLRARIGISEVELEDAHVPVLPQKRKQLQRALADAMDAVLLSADTATTGNINYNGGTIDKTDVTDVNGKFLYGGGVGLAYIPLITDPTNLLENMGGSPTLDALWDLQAKLKESYMEDQANLVYVVDTRTWLQLRKMEELLTVKNYGSDATVLKGEVAKIGMIPVIVSSKLKLSNDDGLVSSTATLNKKGRALLIYRPTNYIGYRRNPNVWSTTDQDDGATVLGVSVRMATTRFDDEGIAMLKNITV